MPQKICPKCGKPGEFAKSSRTSDGLQVHCKSCQREAAKLARIAKLLGIYTDGRTLRRKTPEQKRERRRKWYAQSAEQKDKQKQYGRENRERLAKGKCDYEKKAKSEGIAMYGGVCQCCGEWRPEFLTIDHTEGRMSKQYKIIEGESRCTEKSFG